jgi:tetratricopeptide (TPR) repeat protein/tRNA A-37 threonylcarbamoyl transferase component Bud32
MDSDRNLLFGVLALLTEAVTRDQFVEGCTSWSTNKDKSLADVFAERGWLTPGDRANVERVVEQKLKEQASDATVSLVGVTGEDVEQTLVHAARPDNDRTLLTNVPKAGTSVQRSTSYPPASRERHTRGRLHATGGLGRIWVARDDDLGRDVALKELLSEQINNPSVLNRFLEEAMITGQLEHPNIVPVYQLAPATRPGESPFYTMRFVRGRTLGAAIQDYHQKRQAGEAGPVELRELLNHFVAVCNAVAYAHSRGVLHRDLKPSNVVLGDYGEAIVLDWGLAKVKDEDDPHASKVPVSLADDSRREGTMLGQVLGTPGYMPPEQAEGRPDLVNERSDVYGLGAVLYEILVGEPPFDGNETAEILRRVVEVPPVPPRRKVHAIPPDLEAICLKALAKKSADRYASAQHLAADVRRWMADEPVAAWPEPLRVRAGRWARRHRTFVAAAAVLLVSAVLGLSAGTLLLSRANARTQEQRDRAEANFAEARLAAARAEKALASEASARRQTRKALDEMSSQVVADWLSQKDLKLDSAREKFLNNSLAYYRAFAEEAGESEEVRAGAADAYLRIGELQLKLARLPDAEQADRKAVDAFAALAKDFPDRPLYPAKQAAAYADLATVLWDTGKPKESEDARLRSLELRRQLTKGFPDRPDFHQALGDGYRELAVLYSATRRPKEADDSFRQALDELQALAKQFPADTQYRHSLAAVRASWGAEIADRGRPQEAEVIRREALALRKQLVEEAPDRPAYRYDLAISYKDLGLTLKSLARNKEAEEAILEAIRICKQLASEFPSVTGYRETLASVYQQLAILYAGTGRTKEAEPGFRDAVAVRKQLAADFPTSVKFRLSLSTSLGNLGVLLYTTGRLKEAEALYREAIDSTRRLVELSPTVTEYRDRLGVQLHNLALLLAATDQLEPSEATYREAVSVYKKLTEELPNVAVHRRSLGNCYDGLANTLFNLDRFAEAAAEDREAVALLRRLVSEDPKTPATREELAVCLDNLGSALRLLKRPAEAETSHRAAVGIYEALVRDVPEEPHYGEELARALVHVAQTERDRGEYAQALPLLDRARPLLDAALKANPKYELYHGDIRAHRATLAACQAGTGKLDAALTTAEGIGRLGWKPRHDAFMAAGAYSRCLAALDGQAGLSTERRAEQSRLFGDRAVAALRLAMKNGYTDARHLKQDDDMRPLWGRKDFQELMAQMEKKPGSGK